MSAAAFGAGLAAGALTPDRFVANTTGRAITVDHRFVYESDTGRLFFDSDGSGAAARMLIATLATLPTLDAGDLLLT